MLTVVVLAGAVLHHLVAAKVLGGGSHASDHIRNVPLLNRIYDRAEKKYLDPYDISLWIIYKISKILWLIDRAVDWLYNGLSVRLAYAASDILKRLNTGNYSHYIVWSLLGGLMVLIMMLK